MSRGGPDWGIDTDTVGLNLSDHSELAVRLGSPYVYERLGRVLAIDKEGIRLRHWTQSKSDASASIDEDLAVAFMGDRSIKLIPGSGGNKYAAIHREIPYVSTRQVGVSLLFAPMEAGVELRVNIEYVRDGTVYNFNFRILATGEMQTWNGAAWVTQLDTGRLLWHAIVPYWNAVHLSVDLSNLTFKSMQLNDNKVIFSDAPSTSGASSVPNSFEIYISNKDDTGDQDPMYLDAVVVTIDEP